MTRRVFSIPRLDRAHATIVHPPHSGIAALERQLTAIGMEYSHAWPDVPGSAVRTDFVFYDTDMGYSEQFPWKPGAAPMPMIALVGSEAPGRIEWASTMGADALLLKPVGSSGVFSALLMARQSFELRFALQSEIEILRDRVNARQTIVQAVALLSANGMSQDKAFEQLRQMSMAMRLTIEETAAQVVNDTQGRSLRGCR